MKFFLFFLCFLFINIGAYSQGIESGLVAKYCFSGNANDALGVRNATVYGATLTTDRFGTPNEAYSFNGISNYIQMPSDVWVSGNFSFTGWILINSYDSWARFFEFGNGIDKDNVFFSPSQYGGATSVFTIHECSSSNRTYGTSPLSFPTGTWVHIAITLSGDTAKVYKNNSLWYTYKMIYIPCSVVRTQCYFGKSNFSDPYLNGKIDDIRIYKRAISAIEIDSIYKLTGCGLVSPCLSTLAYFKDSSISCYQYQFTDSSTTKATGFTNWDWDFGDGTTSTLQSPLHSFPGYGTYSVRLIVRDNNGCIDTMTKPITIKYTHFANAGSDVRLCLFNGIASTTLVGKGGTTYSWTPTTGLANPTASSTSAVITAPSTYVLSVTDSFGCTDKDTVNLYLYPNNVKASPKDTTLCFGLKLQLKAIGAKTYAWFPSFGLDSSTISNPLASVSSPINYIVQGTDSNGCIGYDTVKIRIAAAAKITAYPKNTYGCFEDKIQLNASGATTYKWTPSVGLNNDSIANPIHTVNGTSTYIVKGVSAFGCEAFDTVTVNQYPSPIVDAYSNENIVHCRGNQARLYVTGASHYLWTPSEYCDDKNSVSPNITLNKTTLFTVTGTNDNGCSSTDTISVIYDGKTMVYVPNAFSPNNDQSNDQIGIVDHCNFILYSFYVFNRWGQNIFSGYDLKSRWDGTFKGKECETGTYYYQIIGKSFDQEEVVFSGDFTLIR